MKKLQIIINKDFMGYKKGTTITVNAEKGVPLDKFWRDRLKDSKIDNCVSIFKKKVVTKKTKLGNQEKTNDSTI